MRRWAQIAFFLSLALNLFFIGNVAVHWFGVRWRPPERAPAAIAERLSARLSGQDAVMMRGAFDVSKGKIEALFEDLQEARRAARVKLTATPFDRDAFAAALANTRAKRGIYDQAIQEVIIGAAGTLSADGRRRLSESPNAPGPSPNAQGATPSH